MAALNGRYTAKAEPERPFVLVASLWLCQSILFASKVEATGNMQGVSISFNVQEVLLISFATWMLHKGISRRNIAFTIPWVVVTLYSLYFYHYKSLKRFVHILETVPQTTVLPWLAVFLISIGIGIGLMLILRTLQLSVILWYQRKLEKELYEAEVN